MNNNLKEILVYVHFGLTQKAIQILISKRPHQALFSLKIKKKKKKITMSSAAFVISALGVPYLP